MKVSLDRHNPHIAVITIENTAKMNALTRQMMKELGKLWDELEADDTRCIITVSYTHLTLPTKA